MGLAAMETLCSSPPGGRRPEAGESALELLNPWQHGFPLCSQPFEVLARVLGRTESEVLSDLQDLQAGGTLSRIGGVFHGAAGGAALLSAMRVAPSDLERVAACVSAHPGVNHNYEREGPYNLWFVMTGPDPVGVETAMRDLERSTGHRALRLPMERAYRIDLGFDLRRRGGRVRADGLAPTGEIRRAPASPLSARDWPLAARVEEGLPLVSRPYAAWAQDLGLDEAEVLSEVSRWLQEGQLRRFGVVVRHHELGFSANAMTVFDVPADRVDACGEALAREEGVTLAYRRARDRDWHYNLYCMVHGRDRDAVNHVLLGAVARCGLRDCPRVVLFSRRRFKQTGARRFRPSISKAFAEASSHVATG